MLKSVVKAIFVAAIVIVHLMIMPSAHAEQVRVAVASNFLAPMTVLAAQFEEQTGHKVLLSTGSSGRFYAQIRNGAPFDLFLSADAEKPTRLVNEGFALASHHATYAQGVLVLMASQALSAKLSADVDLSLLLQQNTFHKLALANPKLAPYGLAAEQTLTALGVTQATRPKWIQGENVSQAFQFVYSGNADLGFVAQSQLQEGADFTVWVVPSEFYQSIAQQMVVLKAAQTHKAALLLFDFLRSPEAQAFIRTSGYR